MQSATIEHKEQGKKTMPRRKRQPIHWQEPRRRSAPTMTAKGVAQELQISIEMVHVLVRNGPELDGLPAYIPAESGKGWIRKHIPTKAEREALAAAGTPYNSHSGTQLFFYEEDIKAFIDSHPYFVRENKHIPYTDKERDLVIAEAEQIKNPDGSVNRTRLLKVLATKHNLHWSNGRKYQKFKQIMDDLGYKLPPEQPKDTSARRKYRAS